MAEAHAASALRVGVDLCIAAGRNPERARALAARLGVPLYSSYAALLDDATVDAVDLCVPNDLHRGYAERAFAAQKHVLCEKPIALTLDDADAMIEGARQAGVLLMIAHVLRFWPEYQQLHDLYTRGDLGTGLWFAARRLTGVLSMTKGANEWRANPVRAGGAALDLQIHDLDYVCWLFGSPTTVFAHGIRSSNGSWDHLVTTLRYADGCGASVEASFVSPGDPLDIGFRLLAGPYSVVYQYIPHEFGLHGLRGERSRDFRPSLVLHQAQQAPRVLARPDRDSFVTALDAELATFAQSVCAGRLATCTGPEARLALAIALASVRSCETGTAVHGPFH